MGLGPGLRLGLGLGLGLRLGLGLGPGLGFGLDGAVQHHERSSSLSSAHRVAAYLMSSQCSQVVK